MIYKDYIALIESLGLKRVHSTAKYMDKIVCMFWFEPGSNVCSSDEIQFWKGKFDIIKNNNIIFVTEDIEEAKLAIYKRIEEIKAEQVNDRLKTMEVDFD